MILCVHAAYVLYFVCLFQDLSEEEADRPTLEVLRELVSFCVLKILRPWQFNYLFSNLEEHNK